MFRTLHYLALCAALLAALPAHAYVEPGSIKAYSLGKILNAVACNASSGARTWTSASGSMSGYGVIGFQADFTYAAATGVTWTCKGTMNDGASWAYPQSCDVVAGTCTMSDAVWTKAVSVSKNFLMRIDFLGSTDVQCVWSCTGGGAGDVVTMYSRVIEE